MDWIEEDPRFSFHDLNAFHYKDDKTVAIQQIGRDEAASIAVFDNSFDLERWLDDVTKPRVGPRTCGLYTVLCSRAPSVFDDTPAPVSYLPFTKTAWKRLANDWHIHHAITKAMARQVAYFSSVHHKVENSEPLRISFIARMSAYLSNDLALSVVFVPETRSVYAVWYGCNSSQVRKIQWRLGAAMDSNDHPLVTIGVFAELERERLVTLVDDLTDQFALREEIIHNKSWSPDVNMDDTKTQEHLALCLRSRSLIDHIRSVKRQIVKMFEQIEELNILVRGTNSSDWGDEYSDDEYSSHFERVGQRIRKRLQEIIDEYDDKIDECNMMTDNLSLTMQTLWNQIARRDSKTNTHIAKVNTTIALETKRDNIQMRSIALLTMVYLPLSSVAAVFSTSLFNFDPADGQVVSSYLWIFLVVSVGLTAVTVFIWYIATNRDVKKDERNNSFYIKEEDMV